MKCSDKSKAGFFNTWLISPARLLVLGGFISVVQFNIARHQSCYYLKEFYKT